MNPSRRSFIKQTGIAMAGTALFSDALDAAFAKKKLTGLQLYSVREDMKSNALATLQQLATMGYKHVEHANYVDRKFYGYPAAEFKKILNDLGLKMPSGHTVMRTQHWDAATKDFTSEWKFTVEDAALLGQEFVISPSMDEKLRTGYDGLMHLLDLFNKSGELCKKVGMQFGYHNHDFEFNTRVNGQLLYDIILKQTDPLLVMQQLDIGNMMSGGGSALEIIKQYPGRFASMHVKDEIKTGNGEMNSQYESTVLGKGMLPVKEIIDQAVKIGGTKHFIIEQESYQGQRPLDAMKENLAIMKKWGYKS